MNAHAYDRVSSNSQDGKTQRAAIERLAFAKSDTIVSWYSERMSGKTIARPELNRLRADVRAGLIRRLYVFRLDRLTRSGVRDTFELMDELRAHGVDLVSVSDGFTFDGSPLAEGMLAMMAVCAKMERIAINDRISAARTRVEASGGKWGRARALSPALEKRAAEMKAAGRSVRAIAVALKVHKSSVQRSLSRKDEGPGSSPDPS